ncbi:hypothetical protein DSO57_1032876 [Entomophthora muscae]|uniref:Uncharacterized protein n=1 Tax=Entomophthora muscae TaxID=34485 RepID=A0ACC2U996_9FUNG|nr:hypothetical protein DSO57_1032876 [Entomophthora muscae]
MAKNGVMFTLDNENDGPGTLTRWAGALENRTSHSIVCPSNVSDHIIVKVSIWTNKGPELNWSIAPVRIDNSSSLKTWAQEQESNPDPGFPRAARPVDCRTTHLRCSGIEPPQADTKNVDPCSKKSQTKEIIAPNGRLITALNRGTDLATISFINLKSTPATNQEPTQERGTGPRPGPMTTTLKQDNQVAKLRFLTNERTPGPSAILLPLDPSTQFPQPYPSQCPDKPPI